MIICSKIKFPKNKRAVISFSPKDKTGIPRSYLSFLFIISIGLFATSAMCEPIHVRLTSPPKRGGGLGGVWNIHAVVANADFSSTEPNPCFHKQGCFFAGSNYPKSWGGFGFNPKDIMNTDGVSAYPRGDAVYNQETMGGALTALRDAGLLYVDMPSNFVITYGMVVFCMFPARPSYALPGWSTLLSTTPVSDCTDVMVPPTNCSITSPDIEFNWGAMPMGSTPPILEKSVTMHCDAPTDIQLAVSGESIVLNGDSRMRALIDLGNGWTGQNNFSVDGYKRVPIKAKLKGVGQEAGAFSGSTVIVMGYQ